MRPACLVLVAVWSAACGGAQGGPPNLLLITVDTLRADRLACYGGLPDVGTAMCALADAGTRFAWAFSAASHTAPSVASLLTSRYPSQHGVRQVSSSALRRDALSVAEVLRAAGYATAAFISNPVLDPRRRFGQGFDVYDVRMTGRERNRNKRERDAAAATDAALAWAAQTPDPWLLWVHYQDPHGPYDPPGGTPVQDDPQDEVLPVQSGNSGLGGIPAYQALPGLHTLRAYEHRYRDEIRYLDGHVARLLEGLDARGRGRPAVLLTADHGEAFGEDGFYFAHGHSVGLDQIRVPLLWRPQRPGRARVVETPVSLLDVAPTLLRAAGLETPGMFEGRPLPLDGADAAPRPVFAEHRHRAAVVLGRTYWSRDRRPQRAEPWYPARSAELHGAGALPDYAFPEAGPEPAERELLDFLARTSSPAPGAETEVPDELRERLRALGYEE